VIGAVVASGWSARDGSFAARVRRWCQGKTTVIGAYNLISNNPKKIMKRLITALALCTPLLWQPVSATTLTWIDSGAYSERGDHNATNTNYLAGYCTDCNNGLPGPSFNNFFVFDTSGVQGTVTSATLRLRSGYVPTGGLYSVFNVSTPIGTLRADHFGATGIYDDLGSGVQYGNVQISSTDVTGPALIDVLLNDDAIAAINASTGLFALGGTFASEWHAFGGTNTDERRQLILGFATAVPEPSSVALLGLGLGLTALIRRRKGGTAST
jgi:hypothetical protein